MMMMMVLLNIMYGDVCTDDRCTGGVQAGCIMTVYTGVPVSVSQSCSAGRRVHIPDTLPSPDTTQ